MSSYQKIILQYEYDTGYRHLLWKAFKEEYDRVGLGRIPFFNREMKPRIDRRLSDIEKINGPDEEYTFQYPTLDDDRKFITEYVNKGGVENDAEKTIKVRYFSALIIRMFDAYMQIKQPVIASTFSPSRDTDATGMVFGEFLSDVTIRQRLFEMAIALQTLIGIYEYQEESTSAEHTGYRRHLAIFKGNTVGYLLVMDFCWSVSDQIIPLNNEHLMLYYGFCIPGRKFSPIVMRSLNQRDRQTGFMYGKEALVDFTAPTLDQIYLQTFTTDIDHYPDLKPDQSHSDQLFAEVMRLKNGPTLSRTMYRIKKGSVYNAVAKRIGSIKRDRL